MDHNNYRIIGVYNAGNTDGNVNLLKKKILYLLYRDLFCKPSPLKQYSRVMLGLCVGMTAFAASEYIFTAMKTILRA